MYFYSKYKKQLKLAFFLVIFLLVICCIIARYINLNADFPRGVSSSGDLYTDEGGYARNSIAYTITGKLYVTGDFNSVVNCPVLPIIQILIFKIFGMSFVSARTINATFGVLIIILMFLFMKKYKNIYTALLCILLLSTNFLFFSFNRIALLETPTVFFAFLSTYLIYRADNKYPIRYAVFAGISASLCILTKFSGSFIIPIILYILIVKKTDLKTKLHQLIAGILTVMSVMAVYFATLVKPYYKDFVYFNSGQLSSNLKHTLGDYIQYFKLGIIRLSCVEGKIFRSPHVIYVLAVLVILMLFIKSFRKDIIYVVSIIWILLYEIELAIHDYFPERYYVVFIVPIIMIVGCIWNYIYVNKRTKILAVIFSIFIILLGGYNFTKIVKYTLNPTFSYYNISEDIKKIINTSDSPNKIIMGQEANTISIQNHVFAVNNLWGTYNLDNRIKLYRPSFYLTMPGLKMETETLEKYYNIELIKEYDVFNNYYTGEPVSLYRLIRKQ